MTDTATQTAENVEGTEDSKRKFDVEYTLEVVDDLPPQRHGGGGGGGTSPLELKLEELKGRTDAHGKWVLIGKYGKATAAGAAANVLRIRHGRTPNVEGYEFAYRKIDQEGSSVNGLFVRFDPEKIVPGAKEQHESEEKARLARLAEARTKREAGAGTPTDGNGNMTEPATQNSTPAEASNQSAVAQKVAAAQKAAAKK